MRAISMNERIREWAISILFVVIVCVAVWTVFGDDLVALAPKS
jgi:hypothetical protein